MDLPLLAEEVPGGDLNLLEALRGVGYSFVPGRNHIRPTPQAIEEKLQHLDREVRLFRSETDYVLHAIFGDAVAAEDGAGGRRVAVRAQSEVSVEATGRGTGEPGREAVGIRRKFIPNRYCYQVPEFCHHYVMWYDSPTALASNIVTEDIRSELTALQPSQETEFVWYENPKPNMPEVWHVQVFWSIRK